MAPMPALSELARLEALHKLAILDTPPEEAFDQLAQLAAQLFGVPMAMVNLVDAERQWFKAAVGLPLRETERAVSFCTHWLDGQRGPFVVPDATQDPLFSSNPLVLGPPHIRFYACAPLVTAEGLALGTLAVMDTQPRTPGPDQLQALQALARQTLDQIELRHQRQQLARLACERESIQARLQEQAATLRRSEERFEQISRATTDTVWDWDVQTNALWWGGTFRELLHMPPQANIPTPEAFAERLHPDDRKRVIQSMLAATRGPENTWQSEYRMRRDDGQYIWIHDRGFVIRDSAGQALRMVGGMSDISERKQAELAALREARTHAELVRVQQQISSLSVSLPAVLERVAQTALQATRASGAMVEMLDGDRLVSQASVGLMVRPLGAALPLQDSLLWSDLKEGRTVLCNDTQAEGWTMGEAYQRQGVRAALAVPLRVDGTVVGALKVTSSQAGYFSPRDLAHLQILSESLGAVVQLRQVAARLQASEQQYKLLFDAHAQPMWVYAQDESLRFLAVNQAMQALYGYSAQELLHMSMHDLWLPHQRTQLHHEILAIAREKRRDNIMGRHLRKDGSEMDIEMSSRSILFNGLQARQVMATDVTERLRTQRELARMARARHMLSSCNETLVRATSETALLQAVCRIVVDIGGYQLGWVGFAHDDAQKTIEIAAHAGGHADYLDTLRLSWSDRDPSGQGPAGATIRSGQPVIVRDVRAEPAYAGLTERMESHGFHGVISLPLRAAQHTFGLLYLYAPEVLHIGPEESELLQELANDLAFGLLSLRARKEQQQLQASVLKMAAAVSAATGTEFFIQLARNMSEALGAQVGAVGRLLPAQPGEKPRAVSLALVIHGELVPNVEYELEGTPSEHLLTQRQFVVTTLASPPG